MRSDTSNPVPPDVQRLLGDMAGNFCADEVDALMERKITDLIVTGRKTVSDLIPASRVLH